MREGIIERKTNETDIKLRLNIDGSGISEINSGNGFFDHMLTLLSKHSGIDIKIICDGDKHVDFHHSCEDIGICLGKALRNALGDMKGVSRYADVTLPMDEALILSAVDISGRGMLCFSVDMPNEKAGDFDTELVEEFFTAFAVNAGITIHIRELAGKNTHHIIEGIFKSVARSLRKALEPDTRFGDSVPSTKGVL